MNAFPQEIGRYQLLEQLGSGGMGAVYKAQDLKLKREVALKIMHPSLSHNEGFRDRFLQEAQSGARLKHPGIVQVHDIGEENDYLFIVEDFISGENLAARMKVIRSENRTMAVDEAVELVRQVSQALGYAHEHGVLHRDIKPANILLEPVPGEKLPYRPVLTDLGLAKLMVGGLETQTGISMGTPAYMAPEQALGQAADARSDIYALGVLLYELLSGRPPFPLKNVSEAMRCHMYEPPPIPPPLPIGTPEPLSNLLKQTLQRNRDARPASAMAFATMLERILEARKETKGGGAGAVEVAGEKQGLVGPSPWKKFQSSEEEQDIDRVEVFLPGGECRIVKLEKGPFIIGRDESSDIVLDDLKASRKHARLEFDGVNYQLTDLNSTNGSFFGKTRLLPGVDDTWDPEKPLRIGDHYLRLVRIKRGDETVKFKGEGTLVDWKPAVSSQEKGWVGVAVPQLNLFVEAGKSAVFSFSMINRGNAVDHFQISIEGLPVEWVLNIPAPLQITPGISMEVALSFQPPRRPDSRATRYPFIMRVKSQNNPAEIAETRCTLTILPFTQFTSLLEPQSIISPENGKVIIHNQGNVEEAFTITFYDQKEALVFSLSESNLRIPEGKAERLEFTVSTRKSPWLGGEKKYPFTVTVSVERKTGSLASLQLPSQTLQGEFISRGKLAAWLDIKN